MNPDDIEKRISCLQPERISKLTSVAAQRQSNLTVILENIYDEHNVGAVLRTCDSVGVKEIYVLNTEPDLWVKHFPLAKRCSKGARKWIDVHYYKDRDQCFTEVRNKYEQILAAYVNAQSTNLYELDLSQSVALLFGNEREGLSLDALKIADGTFYIPQYGMTESLNLSVACAVSLYESLRQRSAKGLYSENQSMSAEEFSQLKKCYLERAATKERRGAVPVITKTNTQL